MLNFVLVLRWSNRTYLQECGLAGSLLQSCDGNGRDLFHQPRMCGGTPPAAQKGCKTATATLEGARAQQVFTDATVSFYCRTDTKRVLKKSTYNFLLVFGGVFVHKYDCSFEH